MRAPLLLLAALAATGCGGDTTRPAPKMPVYNYGPVEFKDDAEPNSAAKADDLDAHLVGADGQTVDLKSFRGKKPIVLVVSRGATSNGPCPYCRTQTTSLIAHHAEFAKRDAQVLLVFPGAKDLAGKFAGELQSSEGGKPLPFPLLVDEKLELIERLGIRADLSKPAAYILDKEGKVRFAYVGSDPLDRPSVKALLRHLDQIVKG